MFVYRRLEDIDSFVKIQNFDAANKFLPVILLVVTIQLFRRQFTKIHLKKFFPRERLILVHTIIFVFYGIVFAISLSLEGAYFRAGYYSLQGCRLNLSGNFFFWLSQVSNIAQTVLFIYMSIMFSKPLTGYWESFLLSYRQKSLSIIISEKIEPTKQERARRYHEAAVRDANRQITVMMALVIAPSEESLPSAS